MWFLLGQRGLLCYDFCMRNHNCMALYDSCLGILSWYNLFVTCIWYSITGIIDESIVPDFEPLPR